jgi:hypothetical protein
MSDPDGLSVQVRFSCFSIVGRNGICVPKTTRRARQYLTGRYNCFYAYGFRYKHAKTMAFMSETSKFSMASETLLFSCLIAVA